MLADPTGDMPTIPGVRRVQIHHPPAIHRVTATEWLLFTIVLVDTVCILYAVCAAVSDLPHVPESLAPYLAGILVVATMALIAKRMRAAADRNLIQVGADVIELRADVIELRDILVCMLERQAVMSERQATVERQLATLVATAKENVSSPNANGRYRASMPTPRVYLGHAAVPSQPATVEVSPAPKIEPLAGYLDDAAQLVELGKELQRDRREDDDP